MVNVQRKSGKIEQVDEKKTVEEVAKEMLGIKPGDKKAAKDFCPPIFYSASGKQLQPRRSFSEQGVGSGDTVLATI